MTTWQVPLVETEAGNVPVVISVSVSVSAPMQSEEQLNTCNLMSVAIDGVFALPDHWPVTPTGAWPCVCTRTELISLGRPNAVDDILAAIPLC